MRARLSGIAEIAHFGEITGGDLVLSHGSCAYVINPVRRRLLALSYSTFLLLLFVAALQPECLAVPAMQRIENFTLSGLDGEKFELYAHADARAIVIISQGNGCPIARLSVVRINELAEQYAKQGVTFLMINANPQDSIDQIRAESADFQIKPPIFKDESQSVSRILGITRTAEVVVIKPQSLEVVYRGALDDRLDYQIQRATTEHHYLVDALNAILNGKEISVPRTVTKGCLISRQN